MHNIIHHKTLREEVADSIRKKILYHELEPGMRVTESEFAEQFGVSHGPIREALRQLEQEGLLVYTRNVGCSVRDLSLSEVTEALLMRGTYELTALRACKGNLSDNAFRKMEEVLDNMKKMDGSDYTESIIYDNEFHTVLICEANMPYLTKAWHSLDFATFFTFYRQTEDYSAVSDKQYRVHKALYDTYLEKDCAASCNAVYGHYKISVDKMLKGAQIDESAFPYSFDVINPNTGASV